MEIETYTQMLARVRAESAAHAVQLLVLGVLVASFYVVLLWYGPPVDRALALYGTIAFAAAYALPSLSTDAPGSFEPIFVFMGAFAAFYMPPSFHPPISHATVFAGTLGFLAAEGIWAVRRYPVERRDHVAIRDSVQEGVRTGLFMALGIAAIAAVILTVRAIAGYKTQEFGLVTILLLFAGYLLGGILAGATAGLLRPLVRWPLGTMLVGIIGGIIVYGAIAPAAQLSMGRAVQQISVREGIEIACACGLLVGPPAALGFGHWRT